ncbi:M6 family metalloprotease domain-containing protein [Candidatus Magnetobacterium bavaricum]|uniref:M6 family metalloprotease domain-containing protein n=1 Tax=Candidatus Magnetobacterium bavaricum TaxID=29290 RepID=A0A0F3GWA0_9BACT|nr:M6 family metalloprotease domain-containing protein [Candidatus Magnetobacterium bavaricum]
MFQSNYGRTLRCKIFTKPKSMPDMYVLINVKKWLLLVVLSLALGIPAMSFAVPANPDVNELKQPDGSIVMGVLRGDEWSNWVETVSGYTIGRGSNGYWYYVTGYGADNKPVLSSVHAHEEPTGLLKHTRPLHGKKMMRIKTEQQTMAAVAHGTFNGKILFILAQFNDIKGTYTEHDFAGFLENNIADYYYKASNGKVTLTPANESSATANNGVVDWVTLNYNHPNTGEDIDSRNIQIAKDAILAADPYVDFASYDTNHDGYVDSSELAVVVIVAGYETSYSSSYTPSVWGHQWYIDSPPNVDGVYVGAYHAGPGGYAQFGEVHQNNSSNKHKATLGIMVHELGHLIFDLPDLYDTDSSSEGLGCFCLMASGSWGRASTDAYSGITPVLPSAWIRSTLGWIDAYIAPGNLAFTAIGASSATASNTVYKASSSLANEYFLVENRQPQGYDKGLERWLGNSFGGLAIFHIDDNVAGNDNDTHRKVDLVEAYGTEVGYGSPTDLWYAGNATTFNDTSSPNSKLYNGSSSGFEITAISAKDIIMTASTSGGTTQYALTITRNGTGSGSVTSNLGGISCGATCTANFDANTQVTLTALADSGSTFAGWGGDCTGSTCTVTMSAARNVSARFDNSAGNNTVFSHVKKDFDGDGKGDILWHNSTTGDVVIWLMNGLSISQGNYVIRHVPLDWQIKAIGDFNGDGKSDVLWQSASNGDVALWLMNALTISSGGYVIKGIPSDWTLKAVGDFDGDGKVDVLWQNTNNGDVAVWFMDGASIKSGDYVAKGMPSDWTLKAVTDINRDGKSDMVWQAANGDVYVWLMDGAGITGGGFVAKGIPGNWLVRAIGDFDGNGDVDVLWQETTSGDVAMWLMDGLTIGGDYVVRGLPANWQVLTTGDFNGDGKADVFLQDTSNGDIYIWLMDGTGITGGGFVVKALPLQWWAK